MDALAFIIYPSFHDNGFKTIQGSTCGKSTSTDCLSDLSSCDESTKDCCCEYRLGSIRKVARTERMLSPLTDAHSLASGYSDACVTDGSCRCSSTMEDGEAFSSKIKQPIFLRNKLSITIPQSDYFIFPSDLPKSSMVECIQTILDSISLAFQNRFDKDKRAWAVYSTFSTMATRFKIHVYEFDGVTHVEMRAEAGHGHHAEMVFCMLQAAVGRIASTAAPSAPLDSFFEVIADCVSPSERISDRDMRRNLKSILRSIQTGSAVELESACMTLLQAALFEELIPVLQESLPTLIDRLIVDNLIGKLSQPAPEPPVARRGTSRSRRQRDFSVISDSSWNACVRVTELLRRLSTSVICLDELAHNSSTINFFIKFITESLNCQRAFLMRRNIIIVLSRLSEHKPYETQMAGLAEKDCLNWLYTFMGQERNALQDPIFLHHVQVIMLNLSFSTPS